MSRLPKTIGLDNTHISVEETILTHSVFDNFDLSAYRSYYEKEYGESLSEKDEELLRILNNKQLFRNAHLTMAGAVLFSKEKTFKHPNFCVKAVSFYGNNKAGNEYRDSEDFYGSIPYLYKAALSFIKRNLPKIQKNESFNVPGVLEIPPLVFEELIANTLVHRDYYYQEPVELLIFDDRIEIVNPGNIPSPLTVEDIKQGKAKPRNPIIVSYATDLIPYRGLGTGIIRAYAAYPFIEYFDDNKFHKVICSIARQTASENPQRNEARPELRPELPALSIKILNTLAKGDLGKKEIAVKIGHKSVSGQLNKQIRFLLDHKYIEQTLPHKPNSPHQKYKITTKGLQLLNEH